jgi:5-methylcytosine-specific restriction protein A
MPRALKVCSVPNCPELCATGRCEAHQREAEQRRGTAAQRGYNGTHWRVRRRQCLRRDALCRCTGCTACTSTGCTLQASVADHDPYERRDLVDQGIADPDALTYLKGKCKACHDAKTAATRPGGWHQPHS